MSVRVRLTRVGSKKNPIWRVVVADGRSPRDGRFIEAIGHYNPQTQPSTIRIDEERFQHWVARGAQPTGTVKKLMQAQARSGPSELDGAGATATAVAEPEAPAAEGEQPAADASQAPAGGDQLASEGEQPAADAGTATGPEGGPAAAEGAVREEPAEQDGGGVAGAEAPGAAGDAEEPELPPAEDQPSPEA